MSAVPVHELAVKVSLIRASTISPSSKKSVAESPVAASIAVRLAPPPANSAAVSYPLSDSNPLLPGALASSANVTSFSSSVASLSVTTT